MMLQGEDRHETFKKMLTAPLGTYSDADMRQEFAAHGFNDSLYTRWIRGREVSEDAYSQTGSVQAGISAGNSFLNGAGSATVSRTDVSQIGGTNQWPPADSSMISRANWQH